MRVRTKLSLCATVVLSCALAAFSVSSKQQELPAERIVPTTWDDDIIATLEVPLANPIGSPKQVPSTYYYKIPVRPIFKSYPVYAPGHEPPGYIDWLKQQDPVVLWDEKSHTPPLKTDADWTKAGEMVFDSSVTTGQIGGRLPEGLYVRDPEFYRKTGTPVAADGTVPFYRYLVFEKGKVEIGILGCGMCHTRVMPDGSILKGAQGNFPFDRAFAYNYRKGGDYPDVARNLERLLYAAPWVRPDPQAGLE